MWIPIHLITLFISYCFFFLYLQGLTLLELAAHLGGKAAQLRHEGLGKVKIALAATDTSSLLEILEECFGHMNLNTFQAYCLHQEGQKGNNSQRGSL